MDTPDRHTQQEQGSRISAAGCQTSERSREASKRFASVVERFAFYKKAAIIPAPRRAAGTVGMPAGAVAGAGA